MPLTARALTTISTITYPGMHPTRTPTCEVIRMAEKLLTLAEVADLLSVPIGTLYSWRHRGEGPRGYKMGRHVRYSRASVDAWLSGCLELEGRRGLD